MIRIPCTSRWSSPILPILLTTWILAYGAVRVWWSARGAPEFQPLPQDLLFFTGWSAVALCVAALGITLVLWLLPPMWPSIVAGWLTVGAIVVAAPQFLLDLVGGILPLGIPISFVSFASRAGAVTMAVLLALLVRDRQRWLRGVCRGCGRSSAAKRVRAAPRAVPGWGFWGAYLAVTGCLVRIAAQMAVGGIEGVPYGAGLGLLLFEIGFLAAGVLLPLGLVHRFGMVWPAWVLPLAGRKVPRRLVLWPGFAIGGLITAYFGVGFGILVVKTISSGGSMSDLVFLWVAIPAYLVWGLGLLTAAFARQRVDRVLCPVCADGSAQMA